MVEGGEAVARVEAKGTGAIAGGAARDLNFELLSLKAAVGSPDALDKSDIAELRVFAAPPELMQTVLEAVCQMFGSEPDYASAGIVLSDFCFLRALCEFDGDGVGVGVIERFQECVGNPMFAPHRVDGVGEACSSLCVWVHAVNKCAHVARTVRPERERFEGAQRGLVVRRGRAQREAFAPAELRRQFDESVDGERPLERRVQLKRARLRRAARLALSLGNERVRLVASVADFEAALASITGDLSLAAASAFASDCLSELGRLGIGRWGELEVPVRASFSLSAVLADLCEIRLWNSDGLTRDMRSTLGAIMVARGRLWPLVIDPL